MIVTMTEIDAAREIATAALEEARACGGGVLSGACVHHRVALAEARDLVEEFLRAWWKQGCRALALLALLLPLTVNASEWTRQDSALQATFVAVGLLDVALTDRALRTTDVREQNPILGSHPSRARLWGLGLSGLAAHSLVAWLLPGRARTLWQTCGISVEVAVTGGNAALLLGGEW